MTNLELRSRIGDRLEATLFRPSPEETEQLAAYCELLARWNRRINLTSLLLDGFPESTIDALIVEPLAALRLLPGEPGCWFDFGTGGGSPAVPIKVLRPDLSLQMVESRAKKGAFLREVVRSLEIQEADVWTGRIEELDANGAADLVTMRAVRPTAEIYSAVARILSPEGELFLFGNEQVPSCPPEFAIRASVVLPTPGHQLHLLKRTRFLSLLFHVEQ